MNYESSLISGINRDADAAEDRADLIQHKLIPRARLRWKSLIHQRILSPALVSDRALCDARCNVVSLVKELQELN